MSDFVAFFPAREHFQIPASFGKLSTVFRNPLRADKIYTQLIDGASLLLTESFGQKPILFVKEDGSGWIVIKGVIFDTRHNRAEVNLEELLDCFLAEKTNHFNHYEGTFALAAWDNQKKQGWALNDQASILNLYFGKYGDGFYVTTNALALAQSLGLKLNPQSVREFLSQGTLLAPSSMFAGLQRLNIGQHIRYKAGTILCKTHWSGYEPEAQYRNIREATEVVAQVIVDRTSRYASVANSPIYDLTGGYDSRLLACAANASNNISGLTVTVNGPPELDDVRIANLVAKKMNWTMKQFDTSSFWATEITPEIRRELLYRTNGELRFNEIYHQWLSRPLLAQEFNLHTIGVGGGLLRGLPWSTEFINIGRRQLINIDNLLKFRYLPDKKLPSNLFSQNWFPLFQDYLRLQIEKICREKAGTRTTQQLDAVHIWKMTNHSSLYISSVYNWLPSTAPFLAAGVVKSVIATPWKMRLTSQFQRHLIYHLSPSAAGVITHYGSTAEPVKIQNLHKEARVFVNRVNKLSKKMERVLLKGAISKRFKPVAQGIGSEAVPFLTPEFRAFLNPESMASAGLYNLERLSQVLSGDDQDWKKQASLILKLGTIEALCRELNFKPDPDFLTLMPAEPV